MHAETGVEVLPVVCDLTRKEDIEGLVVKTVQAFKTVDILVTNVGHPLMGTFSDLNEDNWQHGYESVLIFYCPLDKMRVIRRSDIKF